MITTQYKITLPSDYDMKIIRDRVKHNGFKTDGFEGLKYKLYLITEKGRNNNLQNSYCPLYLWDDSNGLTTFLFNGFYDNILRSFGWQHVNVGIPILNTTSIKMFDSTYLFQISRKIEAQESLTNLKEKISQEIPSIPDTEYLVIYNPDKWEYEVFFFINDVNKVPDISGDTYQILYISHG